VSGNESGIIIGNDKEAIELSADRDYDLGFTLSVGWIVLWLREVF
jgi:hypothetical protein